MADIKFHPGEIAVQARAGVRTMAGRVANGIHTAIPDAAAEFLAEQPMVFLSVADLAGNIWATVLFRRSGIAEAIDDHTVRLRELPSDNDPLAKVLGREAHSTTTPTEVGLLAIEFATRRRMRLNGVAVVEPGGTLLIESREVYANCPKYIQAREADEPEVVAANVRSVGASVVQRSVALNEVQKQWIASADTFFIASAAPSGRADASHRGGNPGFVHVVDDRTLVWPDYSGNRMFNTLGNITANPRAGLLFLNFATGDTLQLTGSAKVVWDADRVSAFAGAERLVEFQVEQVIETPTAIPVHFGPAQYSRFNPM